MYNGNRFNYDENNINQLNFVNNYANNNRSISPRIVEEQRMGNYYFNEENQIKNILFKNINMNEGLSNAQYQNLTNPMNFIQPHNPQYSDYISNNYYPHPTQQNIYYEPIIPTNNKYIYSGDNINYNNSFPKIIPQNHNNQISKNDYINENNNQKNINKNAKYKNGVKLSISNCKTQYPMTYLSAEPFQKENEFIEDNNNNDNNDNNYIMNNNEADDIYPKTFKKNINRRHITLSKINPVNTSSEDLTNMPNKRKSRSKGRNKDNNYKDYFNITNNNNEGFNNSSYNFHKKNRTQIDLTNSNNNVPNENKYEKKNENLKYKSISVNNYYNNIYGNTKGRLHYEYENNINKEDNSKHHKYNISNKIKSKNNSYNKYLITEYQKQEKFISKLKNFIYRLEKYYILLFRKYFNYFLNKLNNFSKVKIEGNKNSLLQRFQRANNRYSDNNNNEEMLYNSDNKIEIIYNSNNNLNNSYTGKYYNKSYKQLPKNNTCANIFRNVYVPKKNIEYISYNKNNLNHNCNNNINTNYYSHQKNRSLDYSPHPSSLKQHKLNSNDNRLNLSTDYKIKKNFVKYNEKKNYYDNSLDRINDRNNISFYNNNNMNKSQDNLLRRKLSPNLSSLHKRINENMILNKKSIIYVKPKANKINLKKELINKNIENEFNTINANNSINYTNYIYNKTFINNSNYIFSNLFNNKKSINENNAYNTQSNSSIKNITGKRSPIKSKIENHKRHISDFAKEIIDNVNKDKTYKINNQYNDIYSNNNYNDDYLNDNDNVNDNYNNNDKNDNENGNINEIIGNEDLIEETIIKDICTYDKRLWVFIKYVISPKAKQIFLKMKIKRLKHLKDCKNIFMNKQLNLLKLMHTDSFELLPPISTLNSYSKYVNFANKKLNMKEISEEKESYSNILEDENINNKILNLIKILEDYKKRNIFYFYQLFFNLMNYQHNEDLSKENINTNIQNESNNYIYNHINNNKYDIDDDENINENENGNMLNEENNQEFWKTNSFQDLPKSNINIVKNNKKNNKFLNRREEIINNNNIENKNVNNNIQKNKKIENIEEEKLDEDNKKYFEEKLKNIKKYFINYVLKIKKIKETDKNINKRERKEEDGYEEDENNEEWEEEEDDEEEKKESKK